MCFYAYSLEIIGVVSKVSDGDTFTLVKEDKSLVKIRLAEVDCPEKMQLFGQEAKQFTTNLILNKHISVNVKNVDMHGRNVGTVILDDKTNLNEELVKNGLAWWYFSFSKDKELRNLQLKAMANHKGLWVFPKPTPPWIYRKDVKLRQNSK
jgi:endonuclease YncB( thermonuclease family)